MRKRPKKGKTLLVILFEVMFSPSNSQYIVAAGIPKALHKSSPSEPSSNVYLKSGVVMIFTASAYSNVLKKAQKDISDYHTSNFHSKSG